MDTYNKYKKRGNHTFKVENKPNEVKWEIKKAYELGENLIDLCIRYKVNYSTLRNIASREKWKKGKIRSIVLAKEALDEIKNKIEKRQEVKRDYIDITDAIRANIKDTKGVLRGIEELSLLNRAKSVEAIYAVDKELHNMLPDKGEIEYKKAYIEYERLRAEVEQDDTEQEITLSDVDIS
jgi:hypothetical protein